MPPSPSGKGAGGDGWDKRLRALLEMDATNGLSADSLKQLRNLLTPEEGSVIRDQIQDLKCCDPAVGSGAFPVGLLHELVNLRRTCEAAALGSSSMSSTFKPAMRPASCVALRRVSSK